jgi:hypothetical protein
MESTENDYLATFAIVTKTRNTVKDPRSAPATMVSGSPIMGNQLARRDHLP